MAYTTTTKTSYGQRLSGSMRGILTGLILFLIGTVMLFRNEGSFVKQKKALNEAQSVTRHVSDVSDVDASLNGTVIHASALATTSDVLTDPQFGVNATAISISRKVEYYQYEEKVSTKKVDKIGGGQEEVKTYTYHKAWTSRPVESGKFADPNYQGSNRTLATVETETQTAGNVSFGAYRLPPFMVRSIGGSVNLDFELSQERMQYWKKIIASNAKTAGVKTDSAAMIHQHGNTVYFGKSETTPEIGDLKITFTKVDPKEISIIAKVSNNSFEEFVANNGNSFYKVSIGMLSADNMFAGAHSSNSMWTWILRIIGIILVVSGLKSMFGILPALFKVVPFLGNIVGAGVGLICTVIGLAWSLIIISLAWLFYRPLIGVPLLLAAIAGIWYLKTKAGEKNMQSQQN